MSNATSARAMLLHREDDVAIATEALDAGASLSVADHRLSAAGPVPEGHKLAVRSRETGDPVLRYGQIIGFATRPIEVGEHVHTHNLEFRTVERDHAFAEGARRVPLLPEAERATFQGIVRPDGRVATRNFIGVLTTVNCSATAATHIADAFRRPGALDGFPNVDGVVALTHQTGCGMAPDGEGLKLLRRTLAGYARHPNFYGFILVGLGCETNQIKELAEAWEVEPATVVSSMTIQDQGGTAATVREGVARIEAMLPEADQVERQTVPASELILAAECGGSDAYSGITANPGLGAAVDLVVAHGGTAVWGETPEIYGAEHLLTRRATDPAVGKALVDRIDWWQDYTRMHGGTLDNNPSPGNKEGGLTTILEKSLGAVAKSGTTDLMAVYEFAEQITERGMVFMDTPGYDPVSVTGMVAGGANVVAFTTGRGSAFGCKPTPSIKLATNTPMYERMTEDMDLNCGVVLDDPDVDIPALGQRIFDLILATASGRATKSEELGLGDNEFVPWQLGAVM
jgi:altronate hydrolase